MGAAATVPVLSPAPTMAYLHHGFEWIGDHPVNRVAAPLRTPAATPPAPSDARFASAFRVL